MKNFNEYFSNDPNIVEPHSWEHYPFTDLGDLNDTDAYNENGMLNEYFDMIKRHDYSYMYSDDNRWYISGTKSEKRIQEMIHALCTILRVDAERLLEDSISEVDEGYTDGLTHRTIRSWFKDYVSEPHNINVKPYTKEAFKCVDGMYYAGDVFDIDGDGWVSEEQLELLLHEFNNGVE